MLAHTSQQTPHSPVDVLVIGGGPTGLLTTYILVRSRLKVLCLEKNNKFDQALYGRACVIHSGSLELLDLLGIYDRIADIGFIVRGSVTYKDGEAFPNRGWSFIDKTRVGKSYFDFSLTVRQRYLEDAIRSAISELDADTVRAPAKLINYRVTQSAEYPITATVNFEGKDVEVSCKYLVGADGGRSTVRTVGNFPFPGISSSMKWVRLDAVVETNMPSGRSKSVALESRDHGNVLWTPTDNGRTRIGFVCPDDVYGENGTGITEEAIMAAAKNAVRPFTLEFIKLDWWTVYGIGQRIAERFRDGHVFLAGDAAHTHSSGAAQGMNTGIHDAVNLGWKLAGALSGLYNESILDTYDAERRTSAQRLIQLDKDISALISGKIPSHYNAPPDTNANEILDLVFSENAGFVVGIGISYEANMLNQTPLADRSPSIAIKIGHRALDAPLFRPGAPFPKPLRSLISYIGKFWVLIFAGKLEKGPQSAHLNPKCASKYRALQEYLVSPQSFTHKLAPVVEFLTILHGEGGLQSAETLGAQPMGKTLYDRSGEAYEKYGIGPEGVVVVLRPDTIVCFSSSLDDGEELSRYFTTFISRSQSKVVVGGVTEEAATGEISIEGQEESMHLSNS